LTEEIAELEAESAVEQELAALKARMAKASPQTDPQKGPKKGKR